MVAYPWLAHYPEGIDWHQVFSGKPVYRLLQDTAKKFPDHIAIDFLGTTYRYAELWDQVQQLAAGLQSLGVKKGVHVGLYLPNCPQHIISYYAVMLAGGTVVNYSPLYSLHELKHQVKDSDTELMITLDLELLYPKARKLLGEGKMRHLIVGCFADALPRLKQTLFKILKGKDIAIVDYSASDHTAFAELLAHSPLKKPPKITPDKDIAVLQYTGGTTGVPKGAALTHTNVAVNAEQCGIWCTIDPPGEGKTLAVLPFFHVFAMTACLNMSVYLGNQIIMLPRFDLKQTLKTIHRKKPTLMLGVPAMLNAIANSQKVSKYDLTSLKICVSGGAALPLEVKERFEKITGCLALEGYGLTEAAPVTCCNPATGEQKSGSIGLPFPGTIVEIMDMEKPGRLVKSGEIGELCISGPQLMQGYYKRKEATDEVIDTPEDGPRRLHTGDVARLDEDGYVYIVDRMKELIITAGFNVYPRNVEEALYEYEDISEAAVIGVADKERGERVKAFIVTQSGKPVDEKALRSFLKDRLGKHEMPREIEQLKELPKTMIGKIDKKPLREAAKTG